jgi:hypothetical protein
MYSCISNVDYHNFFGTSLEFYTFLSQGIQSGTVDYDKRFRNLSIETDPKYAMAILDKLSNVFCCEEIEDTSLTNSIESKGTDHGEFINVDYNNEISTVAISQLVLGNETVFHYQSLLNQNQKQTIVL